MEPLHALQRNTVRHRITSHTGTHLELRSSICVESTVVIQNIDKLKLLPYSNFIVIRIVSRGDLHGTSSEAHINGDIIRHYWNSAIYKRMNGKLAMKVLRRRVNPCSGLWLEEKRHLTL